MCNKILGGFGVGGHFSRFRSPVTLAILRDFSKPVKHRDILGADHLTLGGGGGRFLVSKLFFF